MICLRKELLESLYARFQVVASGLENGLSAKQAEEEFEAARRAVDTELDARAYEICSDIPSPVRSEYMDDWDAYSEDDEYYRQVVLERRRIITNELVAKHRIGQRAAIGVCAHLNEGKSVQNTDLIVKALDAIGLGYYCIFGAVIGVCRLEGDLKSQYLKRLYPLLRAASEMQSAESRWLLEIKPAWFDGKPAIARLYDMTVWAVAVMENDGRVLVRHHKTSLNVCGREVHEDGWVHEADPRLRLYPATDDQKWSVLRTWGSAAEVARDNMLAALFQ